MHAADSRRSICAAGRCVRLLQGRFRRRDALPARRRTSCSRATARSARAGCTSSTWTARATARCGNRDADRAARRAARGAAAGRRRRARRARRSRTCCDAGRARGHRQRRGRAAPSEVARLAASTSAPSASVWPSTCGSMRTACRGCAPAAGSSEPRCRCGTRSAAFAASRPASTCCAPTSSATARSPGPTWRCIARRCAAFRSIALAGLRRHRAAAPICAALAALRRGRGHQRQGAARGAHLASRSCGHSCQTHNPLPRRARRPGGQGRALSRPSRGRRHPRACRRAIATRAPTSWCSTTSPPAPRAARSIAPGSAASRACSIFRSVSPAASARCADAEQVLNAGRREDLGQLPGAARPGADRSAERALRLAVRRRRHRQSDHRRRLSGLSIHRRSRSARATAGATRSTGCARCSSAAPARSCSTAWPRDGTRDGYDIEQLRRVRALCHVPLVASGGAGAHRAFRARVSRARRSMRRWPRACFTAARSRFRTSSGHCAPRASRCDYDVRSESRAHRLGQGRRAWCPPSCSTPSAARC